MPDSAADNLYRQACSYRENPADKPVASKLVGLLVSAAKAGHLEAEFELGVMFERGDGVSQDDLPPAGPAVITRVRRFDIRIAPPAQARRAGRFHLAGTPGALVPAFGFPGMSAA